VEHAEGGPVPRVEPDQFPSTGPKLTAIIYDMTWRLMPELHTAANIQGDEPLAKNVLARADRLITISENSRHDAVRSLGLDAGHTR
jgi:hypothetical protein